MATSLRCPKCDAILRLAGQLDAGQKVECPKCGSSFLPKNSEEQPKRTSATTSRSRVDDDEDDSPRTRKSKADRDDDEDRQPKRKISSKRRDDEDDEDDDSPRTRKSKANRDEDDEDDDQPKRKISSKRRRDEDDEDDRPRRSRRKQKESNGSGLLIGLIAGGSVMILLVIGGVVWALTGRKADPEKDVAALSTPSTSTPQTNPGNTTPQTNPNTTPQTSPNTTPQTNRDTTQQTNPGKPNPRTNPGNTTPQTNPNTAPQTNPGKPNPQENPVNAAPEMGGVDLAADIREKVKRATVLVRTEIGNKAGSGSGFIMKSNGDTAYLITNFHVIAMMADEPPPQNGPGPGRPGMPGRPQMIRPPVPRIPGFTGGMQAPKQPEKKPDRKVTVLLNSGTPEEQSVVAEVVAIDDEADLAALRITGVRNLPASLDMDQEAPVAETMPVYIFGFPGGNKTITIGKGSISQLRKDDNNELNDVQINGQINPGNSGGPVVDAQGRLVGIAVATVTGKNIGFAIPTAQLNHMLSGSIFYSEVLQVKQQGNRLDMSGELWLLDRYNKVRGRDMLQQSIQITGSGKLDIPANEYFVSIRLADPMHKIKSVGMQYGIAPQGLSQPDAQGAWPPLANAQKISLQISDQHARGTFKLAAGAIPDQTYAFQIFYVNADGQTINTQPHPVRLTFPKNPKSLTIKVTVPTDEAVRRFVQDTILKTFAGTNTRINRTQYGMTVELDPVEEPKTMIDKIKFGDVTTVEGRTVSVTVKNVELPLPLEADVVKALEDLKSTDGGRRRGAADRLAKAYRPLPERQVEVAKALEPLAGDKDFWVRVAGLGALRIWAIPENVAGLVKLMEPDNAPNRIDIVRVIAKFKDPVAAPALAKLLPGLGDRAEASAALKAIGPAAEKAVIPYLTHKDSWTASEACHILKDIGTAESIPPLKAVLSSKPDFMVGPAATEALKAIESRKK